MILQVHCTLVRRFGAGHVLPSAASSKNHYRGVKTAATPTHPYMASAGKVPASSDEVPVITSGSRETRAGGGGYDSLSGFLIMYMPLLSQIITLH